MSMTLEEAKRQALKSGAILVVNGKAFNEHMKRVDLPPIKKAPPAPVEVEKPDTVLRELCEAQEALASAVSQGFQSLVSQDKDEPVARVTGCTIVPQRDVRTNQVTRYDVSFKYD